MSHGSKNRRFGPKLGVSGLYLQLEFTDGYEMMHRARSSIVEVPYCFSRSSVKFQGHTALKIVEFDPKWAFPDCNSSLNSPMAMKCCTKLETAKERCPIVFLGQPSNFKVTRYKASPILTQIGCFRTIGQWQLSNPSDLPCYNQMASQILWNLFAFWVLTWPNSPHHWYGQSEMDVRVVIPMLWEWIISKPGWIGINPCKRIISLIICLAWSSIME